MAKMYDAITAILEGNSVLDAINDLLELKDWKPPSGSKREMPSFKHASQMLGMGGVKLGRTALKLTGAHRRSLGLKGRK